MATYAIGDVQGCLSQLQQLLDTAKFDPTNDKLWFAGDLVNRGPNSLETLRFVYSLRDIAVVVLGNHDLHLLALAFDYTKARRKDTLNTILEADDSATLIDWLRQQKLMHADVDNTHVLVHAGLPPTWSIPQALQYAAEIESVLQSNRIHEFLQNMYGNQPDTWSEKLEGPERWRLITNYLTRMRFCDAAGKMELECKLGADQAPSGYQAWYKHPRELQPQQKILFGHWAALQGITNNPQFVALDTGCVWGGQLSMLRLDDNQWFRCACQ